MLLIDEAEQTTITYWKKRGFTPNVVFRTSSVEAVRSMVATGAGIAILVRAGEIESVPDLDRERIPILRHGSRRHRGCDRTGRKHD
jgi:DNA-binding transcriptional LysR family regulator